MRDIGHPVVYDRILSKNPKKQLKWIEDYTAESLSSFEINAKKLNQTLLPPSGFHVTERNKYSTSYYWKFPDDFSLQEIKDNGVLNKLVFIFTQNQDECCQLPASRLIRALCKGPSNSKFMLKQCSRFSFFLSFF